MEIGNNTTVPISNSTPFGIINAPSFNLGLVIVLGLLIPLTIIGNLLVCIAFLKYQKVRTATNCFLFSLALSDLAVGFVLIPLWIAFIATAGFRDLPKSFHDGWSVLDITCSVTSMANLAGVSIERWYGVCHPFRHMSMSVNYAILTSFASWVYALAVGSLYLFNDENKNLWVFTTITCLGLCVPFVIMTTSYCAIARKIREKAMGHSQQSGKECKTIRTLVILSAVFILCWLPFAVGSLLANYCNQCALYVLERPALHIFPKALHYANSFVNPVLYSLFCPSFKSAFSHMFCSSRRRPNGKRRRSTLLTTDHSSSEKHMSRILSPNNSVREKRKSNFNGTQRDSVAHEHFLLQDKGNIGIHTRKPAV